LPAPLRTCYKVGVPVRDLQDYRWRGARALVLLHEKAMRELLATWRDAERAGVTLPRTDDPHYASLETLLHHALRSSRGYLVWLCQKLGLPDPGIDSAPRPDVVKAEADRFLEHLLTRWRLALTDVEAERFETMHAGWGEGITGLAMLEHAAMHPQRHRFQLEELMEAQRRR
jgi:hypothetical protein